VQATGLNWIAQDEFSTVAWLVFFGPITHMRIFIISDLHANLEALSALPSGYDELWVLGDLVNYGPDPAAVIDFVRLHASLVIRGNHDHSVGFGADCGCSPRFRAMAEATLDYTTRSCQPPTSNIFASFHLAPASRSRVISSSYATQPLRTFCTSIVLQRRRYGRVAKKLVPALILSWWAIPICRSRAGAEQTIINPGSLGQSKMVDPRACYALWEDGRLELCSFEYPVDKTVKKILSLPLPGDVKRDLAFVLYSGKVPN
jgi:predicted phosphodiesterase